MKDSLKGFLDEPRGSAWPPSARIVRCPVKSGNEQDPYHNCYRQFYWTEHFMGTALETRRKVWATVGLYAPNLLGYTRATMVRTMGCNSERRS